MQKFDALTPEELAKSQEEVYNMDDVGGQNSDEGRNT